MIESDFSKSMLLDWSRNSSDSLFCSLCPFLSVSSVPPCETSLCPPLCS